jgi:cytochrome c oxidase subunit III
VSTVRTGVPPALLGMVLFIVSEVMLFGGLFGAHFSTRARAVSWPPEGTPELGLAVPALCTILLLTSSVTQHYAVRAAPGGNARRWMTATVALGAAFITGQAWEWSQLTSEGLTIAANVYGTLFFTMTGAHGLHVLGGLMMLAATLVRLHPATGPRSGVLLETTTYYWHFVDVVWVVLFVTLYIPL